MDLDRYHARARSQGVNLLVYRVSRFALGLLALPYWRLSRKGRDHIPADGPVIIAANHRSFLDPFIIGLTCRRPIYYVAKQELFENRLLAWYINVLGAFPVRRGEADAEMVATAKAILARGDTLVIFPEGTRTRPGSLGRPKRGVGRLVLETGAPVVPLAVRGTGAIRDGWRIRPHKVRVRAGAALRFPQTERASGPLAARVVDRVWAAVTLQWEALGGLPPLRRAAVVGDGAEGTAVAVALARAGLAVDLGCRTGGRADQLAAARENEADLPGVRLPARVTPTAASALALGRHDLVVFAVPAAELPAMVAAHGRALTPRSGLLVLDPAALRAVHGTRAWATASLRSRAEAATPFADGAAVVLGARDEAFRRLLADVLEQAGLDVTAGEADRDAAAPSAPATTRPPAKAAAA